MRQKRHNVFVLTWLSYASLYLTRKNFSIVKSELHHSGGLSLTTLGNIDTAFLVVYALGQFVSGFIGDVIGARKIIGVGLLGSAIFSFVFPLNDAAVFFGLCFAINGLFQSTGWANSVKAIEPWFDEDSRGRLLAWWGTNQQTGSLLATILAASLLANFGWRFAFFIPAIAVFIMGVVILFALDDPPMSTRIDKNERPDYKKMLASPVLWGISFSYFGLKLIRYSLLFWLPFYLQETLGIPTSAASYLSISFELGGILGSFVIGWIADRYFKTERAKMMMPLFAMLAIVLYFYRDYAAASIFLNAIFIGLIGVFVFGPDALLSGACALDIGGKNLSGSAAGFINGMGSLGAIAQGLITAYVTTRWGWSSLFYLFVAIALLSSVILLPFWIQSTTKTEAANETPC